MPSRKDRPGAVEKVIVLLAKIVSNPKLKRIMPKARGEFIGARKSARCEKAPTPMARWSLSPGPLLCYRRGERTQDYLYERQARRLVACIFLDVLRSGFCARATARPLGCFHAATLST
jgi:hypothetical protein